MNGRTREMVVLKMKLLNINLLPPPKKKGHDIMLVITLLLLLLSVGSFMGISHYLQIVTHIESTEKEIEERNELRNITVEQILRLEQEITEHNYLNHYSKLHSFLNYIYISPHDLLIEIEDQLPQKARIDSFFFNLEGEVELEGTFNSKGEIATFLEDLLKAKYMIDAQVTNISLEEVATIKKYIGTFELKVQTQMLGGDSHD